MTELLWVNSTIDREWLEWFGESWRLYENYKQQREILSKKINSLKSVNYDSDKVTNGASSHLSEQERYSMKLERINSLIKECEEILFPAKERLKKQISRIKRAEYRKILILRYIERWKWSDVIEECFWYEDNFDKTDPKWKDKIMQQNRAALQKLEELSQKPFVPAEKQLHIGV
jgi:hypothetical protein